ncbi:DNA repair protein RecO [Candidatus Cyrtobacter comes]|uniref:DNA repair protein RecO n=1 Tax=Candidatus Cyrtobacter comes TaxID=675776 RepID=A0ABU5L7K5_9RICK|nr:DNA repair protein RecO [Candidatus Cyrtobacter comes]MDZ5762103.1 DNA repair protein RecO [Candidatus Cyrtobacter comes]
MLIEDDGIVISFREFQESFLLVKCLLAKHGVVAGLMRRRAFNAHIGNFVNVKWKARLQQQLGTYTFDVYFDATCHLYLNPLKTALIASAIDMVSLILQEHEPHPCIYIVLKKLINSMSFENRADFLQIYLEFEKQLLSSAGFGLDLGRCAVTGAVDNLAYISPRSGRAVTKDVGSKYSNVLIPMPKPPSKLEDFLEWFEVLGAFLKQLFSFFNTEIPHSRRSLNFILSELCK